MNQITKNLWIADIQDIREKKIPTDTVLTACQEDVSDNINCRYYHFNMSDGEDNYGGECSQSIMTEAIQRVVTEVRAGYSVTVHCHVGRSRSAAVVIGALAILEDIRWDHAFIKVKEARSIVNPNYELEMYSRKVVDEW